uniref:Uncharacterized protein n=1 Tax=Podoviridae sp. cttxo15 TaxID=2826584 RepID=A0A8S5N1X7_9CAUD|nr:MAG TPA: hypothetical protein [Podoviridae sp. cttxo15]
MSMDWHSLTKKGKKSDFSIRFNRKLEQES